MKHAAQGLTNASDAIRPIRVPDSLFEKWGGKPTAQEVLWTCTTCGQSPQPRRFTNGYAPGKCRCQLEDEERALDQRRVSEQQARAREVRRGKCAKCYSWLGHEWRDEGMEAYSFENFDPGTQPKAFMAALRYAEQRIGNLILWSDASWGTGKTHLAAAICNILLAQEIPCLFTTAQNMFNAFGARMEDHHGYSDLLAMAGEYSLLVIDDLDKVHLTTYKQSIFFEVLDKRYKKQLPTVITTNAQVQLLYDDIIGVSDYIGRAATSRLADMGNGGVQIVEMNGEDYRRRAR